MRSSSTRPSSTADAVTDAWARRNRRDWSTVQPNGWTVDRGPYGLVVESVKVSVFA